MDIQQKLWLAALDGHTEEAQRLTKDGANVNAATDLFKATALHRASLMGKPIAVDVLLKVGANVNQEDGDGLTALHMAANIGNRVIIQNLLRSGATVDAKNRDGRTPLHVAAMNGDFKTTQFLILENATTDALDKARHTPLDLVKRKIEEKKDEGLTEAAEPLYRTLALLESTLKKAKDNKEERSLLRDYGEEVEERFREYLRQGSEDYYEINLMFIGQAGVGKTTLTKGILGELDPNAIPDSTNGIDLHLHRCKYDRQSRQIYPVSKDISEQVLNQRIGGLIQMSLKAKPVQCSGKVPVESLETQLPHLTQDSTVKDEVSGPLLHTQSSTSVIKEQDYFEKVKGNKEKETKDDSSGAMKYFGTALENSKMENSSLNQENSCGSFHYTMGTTTIMSENISSETTSVSLITRNVESLINPEASGSISSCKSTHVSTLVSRAKVPSSEERIERLVPITIWDFGGQEVFYTTHQTFLSANCIYMMAFNLFEFWQEADSNKRSNTTLDTITFWINSVVTYARHAVPGYPKIVLIGTHADCFPVEEKGKILWMIFQKLEKYFRRSVQRQHLIISPRHFLDARDAESVPFDLLRQCVMEIAESLPDWGLPIPHKWIVLENIVADLRSCGCKIVSVNKLQSMLEDEFYFKRQEIEDFLTFQQSVSKILYFKDSFLNENIILDPSWVIDALSSFITDERILCYDINQRSLGWNNLRECGQLRMNLIDEVWKNSNFYPFKDYLLDVLCRLDLITRSKHRDFFYVPGMVKEKCPEKIISDIHSSTEVGLVSFKISFKNNFLPPAIYNRMVTAFLSMFESSSQSSTQLFSNCAIFELSRSRWTILHKQGYEIEIFTYICDRRGRAADIKSFRMVYSITLDCLKDLMKIYSAFQNVSVRQSDLPFEVRCQGCRISQCYISKGDFHELECFRCPIHGEYLCSVETLEEIFGSKEFKEENGPFVNTADIQPYPCIALKENAECFLDYIASKVSGSECVFLSAALGFGVTFVEKQRHEYSSTHELAFSILYNWQTIHSLPQNIHQLMQAFGDFERQDIIEEMKCFTFHKFWESASLINIPNPDKHISDEDLVIVSKKVKYIKRLLRFLQIPQRFIEECELELKGSPPDVIALVTLSKWGESKVKPSRRSLIAGLLYVEFKELVDKLTEKWQTNV
ncbi:uncharacterized protein LOC133202634 [Saccostrea echinata]|uniref:uncharacterized protein LOC133202634 n=1 Tax=Saccostrea echinata TaxID=191078 RepID=UPI002A819FE9|nr:uncharacterized protein LOC133202634 [Saccostrea echinata]